MLFLAARHEALAGDPWDAAAARAAVRSIVAEALEHRRVHGRWRVHPLDEVDASPTPASGFKSLYLGDAGVLWALWFLRRVGAVTEVGDPAAAIEATYADYLAAPDTGAVVPSYYLGEVGVLLVLWRLTGSASAADRLHAAITANIPNPTCEALWAAPGTMVAAHHLYAATGEARWRALYLDNVDEVWRTWCFDEAVGAHLWTQDLYGQRVRYLGAGHGLAGNVYALLRGADVIDPGRREALFDRCVAALEATVRIEDEAANWPPQPLPPGGGPAPMLMQWCHGAPGIITATAGLPRGRSTAFDRLLLAAGEAVWRAGPLTKGAGLCHGTAGNGVALLKLYQRSGDRRWLERARRFAMHGLRQAAALRTQHGQGRYTLWTGDLGLAVFVWNCLDGTAAMPALDHLE